MVHTLALRICLSNLFIFHFPVHSFRYHGNKFDVLLYRKGIDDSGCTLFEEFECGIFVLS